jgi:hypothetical protein
MTNEKLTFGPWCNCGTTPQLIQAWLGLNFLSAVFVEYNNSTNVDVVNFSRNTLMYLVLTLCILYLLITYTLGSTTAVSLNYLLQIVSLILRD